MSGAARQPAHGKARARDRGGKRLLQPRGARHCRFVQNFGCGRLDAAVVCNASDIFKNVTDSRLAGLVITGPDVEG